MRPFFVTAFIAGLAFGVYVMIRGVERTPRLRGPLTDALGRQTAPARTVISPPVVAAFLALSGIIGYALARTTQLPSLGVLVIALAVGAIASVTTAALITKWLIPSSRDDAVDERYLLQGHLARTTSSITPSSAGEIVYEVEGVRHTAPATSIDGSPIANDADVVIERFENGQAIVEPWVDVEQRL